MRYIVELDTVVHVTTPNGTKIPDHKMIKTMVFDDRHIVKVDDSDAIFAYLDENGNRWEIKLPTNNVEVEF